MVGVNLPDPYQTSFPPFLCIFI